MNPLEYFLKRWSKPKTWLFFLAAETPRERYRYQYLVGPRWLLVRTLAFALWGGKCACGRPATDGHHLTYAGKNQAGVLGMILEVLTVRPVCRKCHQKEHRQ